RRLRCSRLRSCGRLRRAAKPAATRGGPWIRRAWHSDFEPFAAQRQRADAMPRSSEDRVADGWRDRRQRRLADARRRVLALDEMDVDHGCVRNAQQRIAIEVRFLDAAVL